MCGSRTEQKMSGRFGSGEQRGVEDKRAVVFVVFGGCIVINLPFIYHLSTPHAVLVQTPYTKVRAGVRS